MARKGQIRYRTRTIVRRARRSASRRINRGSVKSSGMNLGKMMFRSGKDAVAITAVRRLPDFAGKYQGGVDKIIAGGALKVFKQGGSALIEVGIAELMANGLDDYVVPALGGFVGGAVKSSGSAVSSVGQQIQNLTAYRA